MSNDKIMLLIFHGFSEYNGISKKIKYQADALKACGQELFLCYCEMDEMRNHIRMLNDNVIINYGNNSIAKFKKRFEFSSIFNAIKNNNITKIYIRHNHNASPWMCAFLRKLDRLGVRVILEIPTYPYDSEYDMLPVKNRLELMIDKLYRTRMSKHIYRIVTFTDHKTIWGVPTVKISNGIDFDKIPLTKNIPHGSKIILTGVADMHIWHGYDRIIKGLGEYYRNAGSEDIILNLVGGGTPDVLDDLRSIATGYGIADRVIFHGPLFGDSLDAVLDMTDMGIASLGRHRSGIKYIKTLKNREFAARGIPFVYSEIDEDFEGRPYILKAPANDKPIDIESIIKFVRANSLTAQSIRSSIEATQSWINQMQNVLSEM